MSGIIIKHQDGGSYIMDRHGEFHFYKGYEHCPVGTEVIIRKKPIRLLSRAAAAAAVFLVVTTLGSYTYFKNSILYYAYLDVNPSVEISINRLGGVKTVTGLNEDGKQLVGDLPRIGKLGETLSTICNAAEAKGYSLTDEDGGEAVQFTVICEDEKTLAKLEEWVSEEMASVSLPFENKTVMACSDEERNEALVLGISPGKLRLVKELHALHPEQSMETMIGMSVAELNKEIRELEEGISSTEREVYAAGEESTGAAGIKEESPIADNGSEVPGTESETKGARRNRQSIAQVAITDGAVSLEGSVAIPAEELGSQEAESEPAAVEAPASAAAAESKQRDDYSDSSSGGGGKGNGGGRPVATTEPIAETPSVPLETTEPTTAKPDETTCGRDDDDDDDDKASDSNAKPGDCKDKDHNHCWDDEWILEE